MSVTKRRKDEGNIKMMTVYVPPRANKLPAHMHEEMTNDTLYSMKGMMGSLKNVVMAGIINCGVVNW